MIILCLVILSSNAQNYFERDSSMVITTDSVDADNWGVSWVDYNNDFYVDLFVTNKSKTEPNRLYKNENGTGFTRVLDAGSLVTDLAASVSSSWADIDNDGFIDVFISNNEGSNDFIYTNNGDGTFSKVEGGQITSSGVHSHAAAWGDYNNDGYVDMFIGDYGATVPNKLYTNNGDGTFSAAFLDFLEDDIGNSIGGSWADYDNDGDVDLFVYNTNGIQNWLYENQRGQFFRRIKETQTEIAGDLGNSTGASWGDYDNDGDLDLFVTNSSDHDNYFYENTVIKNRSADGRKKVKFTKVTDKIIVNDGGHSHGSSWIDFDNDGWLDLFVANSNGQDNYLYRNNGDKTFTKIEDAFKDNGGQSFGTAWADYDNDGDLDNFVVNHSGGSNFFYRNLRGNENNFAKVKLMGSIVNKTAIGARIKILCNIDGEDIWQMRQISALTSGIGSMDDEVMHFGLGQCFWIDSILVDWPSLETKPKRSRNADYEGNERINIVEEEVLEVDEYPTSGIIDLSWAFPNPTTDDLNLIYNANKAHSIKVIVQNVGSKQSIVNNYELINGRNQFYYNVEAFSTGIHFITIINEENNIQKTLRFVKIED